MSNSSGEIAHNFQVGDRLEDGREVVYVVPGGYRTRAVNLFGWLRYEGLSPGYVSLADASESAATVIVVPTSQVRMVHGLQRSDPARYGNPPEVVARLTAKRDHIFLMINSTGGAAFVDTGPAIEVARIVNVAANKLIEHARATEIGTSRGVAQVDEMSFELTDLNGNVVGLVERVEHGRLPDEPSKGSVFLFVDISVDGLSAENLRAASRQFRDAADLIECGEEMGLILNEEGYPAGRFIAEGLAGPELRPPSNEHDIEP